MGNGENSGNFSVERRVVSEQSLLDSGFGDGPWQEGSGGAPKNFWIARMSTLELRKSCLISFMLQWLRVLMLSSQSRSNVPADSTPKPRKLPYGIDLYAMRLPVKPATSMIMALRFVSTNLVVESPRQGKEAARASWRRRKSGFWGFLHRKVGAVELAGSMSLVGNPPEYFHPRSAFAMHQKPGIPDVCFYACECRYPSGKGILQVKVPFR